jgi:peptidoglycan/xylan/chitin deacetylase (PgdA/CDA1 family)
MRFFVFLSTTVILLAGCAAPGSRWREDALNRFNSALSAGSGQTAPEETENIRQTLALAERYFSKQLHDDADHLYQLSSQKSQLLCRSLALSKARPVNNAVVPDEAHSAVAVIVATPVSNQEHGQVAADALPAATDAVEHIDAHENKARSAQSASNQARQATSTPARAKKLAHGAAAHRGEPGRTTIYLTFDDGPSRLTLPIAAYLNSQGIAATFFALGSNIKGREKVVRETVALGHRVGNHTFSHDLHKLNGSLRQSDNEIEKTAALLDKLGGDGKLVRIPYGASTKKLASTVASEGGHIFEWDINSLDSGKRGVRDHAYIEQTVLNQLRNSGKRHIIMLFHDGVGHDATLTAIRKLVPRLKQEGYNFALLARNERVAAQSRPEGNPVP